MDEEYEIVDADDIKKIVDDLVDFCEKKGFQAKHTMLAMQYITKQIQNHLEIETFIPIDGTDSIH